LPSLRFHYPPSSIGPQRQSHPLQKSTEPPPQDLWSKRNINLSPHHKKQCNKITAPTQIHSNAGDAARLSLRQIPHSISHCFVRKIPKGISTESWCTVNKVVTLGSSGFHLDVETYVYILRSFKLWYYNDLS